MSLFLFYLVVVDLVGVDLVGVNLVGVLSLASDLLNDLWTWSHWLLVSLHVGVWKSHVGCIVKDWNVPRNLSDVPGCLVCSLEMFLPETEVWC